MIGSVYFAGFALSVGIVAPLSDKYGRKWIFVCCLLIQTICYYQIIVTKQVKEVIICNFIIGICSGGFMIMIAYMNEFLPYGLQNLFCTILNAADASILIIQTIYYRNERHWLEIHLVYFFLSCFLIIVIMTFPESPKFNYTKKRYDLVRK